MQGHLRSHGGARPHHLRAHDESGCCGHDRLPHARLFLRANPDCLVQALVCSDCDRDHIYCADCAPHARRRSLHAAGRRYQANTRGPTEHADRSRRYRARRYRARQNKVPHHGSTPDRADGLLAADPAVVEESTDSRPPPRRHEWCRTCCGRRCSDHVGKASCRAGSVETDEEDPIMTVPPEFEAQILRYYHVEKWQSERSPGSCACIPKPAPRCLLKPACRASGRRSGR